MHIKIEKVLDRLSSETTESLRRAVLRQIPDAQFNHHQLYRDFVREMDNRCRTWERMPDSAIQE